MLLAMAVMLKAEVKVRKIMLYVALKHECHLSEFENKFTQLIIGYLNNSWMNTTLTHDFLDRVIG